MKHFFGFLLSIFIASTFCFLLKPTVRFEKEPTSFDQHAAAASAAFQSHVCTTECIETHTQLVQPTVSVTGLDSVRVRFHCEPIAAFTDEREGLIAELKRNGALYVATDFRCGDCKSPGCVEAVFYLSPRHPVFNGQIESLRCRYSFVKSYEVAIAY